MKLNILKLDVYNLFGYKNIQLDVSGVTVLVGDNGTGKSTLLRIIHSLLTLNNSDSLRLCERAELWLDDGIRIRYTNYQASDSKELLEKVFVETINSKIDYDKVDAKDLMNLIQKNLDAQLAVNAKEKKKNNFQIINKRFSIPTGRYIKEYLDTNSIEFISNVDLSANSRLNFTTMEGEDANMLDNYIKVEIDKISLAHPMRRRLLIKEINLFLKSSGKTVKKIQGGVVIECERAGDLNFESLSSGEKQLFFILLKIANTMSRDAVILMDEPEISLHLNWQEMLIDSIRHINSSAQIIIVTHSPGIVMNGYRDAFRDIKNLEMDSK